MVTARSAQTSDVEEIHRDVTASGVRLRTTEWSVPGNEGAEAIVALPGLLAFRESYRPLGVRLAHKFRFVAVDFPGFGESERPSPERFPYGATAFANAVMDLFAGLGLSRAHVLGHGLGGAVAVHLAAERPELVRQLALIAPMSFQKAHGALGLLVAPLVGGLVFRQLLSEAMFSRLYRSRIQANISAQQLARYYECLASPAARLALLSTLRHSLDPRPMIANSRRVRSPTLLVWGRLDQLAPVEQGRQFSREMAGCGLSIIEAGHAPHEEAPDEVARLLETFFSGERAGLGSRTPIAPHVAPFGGHR